VVCSLEAWDEVWRRNQFLVDGVLRSDPRLSVLFAEPAVDVPYEFAHRRKPAMTGLRPLAGEPRIWLLRPRKLVPRRLGGDWGDVRRSKVVASTVARLGLPSPLLWVNDASYAELAEQVTWPVVYDITDDWLLFGQEGEARERLRRDDTRLLRRADEVVVVSESLAASRRRFRAEVHIIPNGVDVEHFRRSRPRPLDLPTGKVALYVGTQHDERVDVELCMATARAISPAKLVFVGPNCMRDESTGRLLGEGCLLLGTRPYDQVPAYYQHADLMVVPHLVTPFTESLDPIKGYECLAVGRPTLSTPVAGMRDLGPPIEVCPAERFPGRARQLLAQELPARPGSAPTWAQRAEVFATVLDSARKKRAKSS
jgi:glycosyltransferase involved in cell wall biosynthesis